MDENKTRINSWSSIENTLNILAGLVLISAHWWTNAIIEHINAIYQIFLGIPFLIFTIIGAVVGPFLILKTLAEIFNWKDKKIF